jgi:hypothetical protein
MISLSGLQTTHNQFFIETNLFFNSKRKEVPIWSTLIMNKRRSPINIVNILKMMRIKQIGSPMTIEDFKD